MLAALKNLPLLVDGLPSRRLLTEAAGSWNAADAENTEGKRPQGEAMKHETTKPSDESVTSTLAQMAQGLAQAYADRERPERTGRLHRV